MLGRALSYQQSFEEAEEVLASANPSDPDLFGEIASVRGHNLGFGMGRTDEARDVIGAAVGRVESTDLRARLLNERAMVSAIHGDFADTRSVTEQVLADQESSDVARVAAYVTLTVAQGMTGDCEGLDSIIDDAVARADGIRDQLPFALDQIEIMHMTSLVNAGRIAEAIALVEEFTCGRGRDNAMGPTWLNASAVSLEVAGQFTQAADAAERAWNFYSQADPFGLEPQVRGLHALARGQQGDTKASESLEGLVMTSPAPRITVWVDRGRAWAAVANNHIDEAVAILIAGGENAVAGEHFAWAALCFHDVVRLGRPKLALDQMRGLPAMPGADLVKARQNHAAALASGDTNTLAAIANRFATFGAVVLAAEAWAQTATLIYARGDKVEAARLALLSFACEMKSEAANTPALRGRPILVSDRESQLALAAASGLTSPQIAAEQFISVRTVDNHLRSVYRKLRLSGRDELRSLLSPVMPNE